jgi:hypothetical protein
MNQLYFIFLNFTKQEQGYNKKKTLHNIFFFFSTVFLLF